ncbi:MAG: DUF3467 domain-containing protein [Deltaproteobacteria bacterium]|nr:DUF3467 domain-containing protein [Deltaproteobacteria bacterium]
MAEDRDHRRPETNGHSDASPEIVWDDTQAQSLKPNVWELVATREEIALIFGAARASDEDGNQLRADIAQRIILNPFVAKRVAHALDMGIRHYESRYGILDEEARIPSGTIRISPAAGTTPPAETEKKNDTAGRLFRLVRELNVQVGFERSFKICRNILLENRFLLGASKKAIGENALERVLDICARMNMPADFAETLERHFAEADYIHFGFEENEKTCVYKAYLEFYEKIGNEIKPGPKGSDHFLLHLGFKWDASDNARKSLTNYTWYPSLSVQQMVKRMSAILETCQDPTPFEVAKGILETASRRMPLSDILYLEVTEEGNPRSSFDVNTYRAGLELRELYPFLLKMFRHYSIPAERFQALYVPVKTKIFGHISGGMDREGRDFLTVYYGVEGIRGSGDEPAPGSWTDKATPPREAPPFAGVETTEERASLLFQLVSDLNVTVGFERSFKVFKKTLLADRFLMGFRRESLGQEAHERVTHICRQINMPDEFLDAFQEHLPESNIVLFGFEGNGNKGLYKAYLEFGGRIAEAVRKNPGSPEPFPIHMAFKWDASAPSRKAAAEYILFPAYNISDILKRLSGEFYPPQRRKTPLHIVEGIIELAASRMDPNAFIYFEAREEDNPRTSFDINLYPADLRIKELYPYLLDMVTHYSIPEEPFHHLYAAAGPLIFGHLTGGTDREGRDFLTLYFGEKGSSGLRVGEP